MSVMGFISSILGGLAAIYGMIKLFKKNPEDEAKQFDGDLNNAFSKAEDPKDPDPSDLSKLINDKL